MKQVAYTMFFPCFQGETKLMRCLEDGNSEHKNVIFGVASGTLRAGLLLFVVSKKPG